MAKFKEVAKKLSKRWFIDAFTGMALGLFATLIAGTIFEQLSKILGDNKVALVAKSIATVAKTLMGAGIGAGIAYILKADKLVIFSAMVAGMVGASGNGMVAVGLKIGNPIGAYITALLVVELCGLISGKTKIDIILIPLIAMIITFFAIWLLCPPVNWLINQLSSFISAAMEWNEFVMGIIIAVVMGLLLTFPTSSAAIWVTIASVGSPTMLLAGGAAVVGCASQMIGFAVASYKENGFSGLISQGLGTSMLQIPNIVKNWKILIPPTVASFIVGPLATTVFKLRCNATGGGMGTAGLVGLFGTLDASAGLISPALMWTGIILLFFVLPGVIAFFMSKLCYKLGWIREGDYKLN